jgi:hypothetical protein
VKWWWEWPNVHGPADVGQNPRILHHSWAGQCRLRAELSLQKWHLYQCSTIKTKD